jgi:hypothetical protein
MESTARGISGVSLIAAPGYGESRTALLTTYQVPEDVSVLTWIVTHVTAKMRIGRGINRDPYRYFLG